MPKSIIEESDGFSIWCEDEQNYTVFGVPKGEDDFLYIQQEGFGYNYSLEQVMALHKWLGKVIKESKHHELYQLKTYSVHEESLESIAEIRARIAELEAYFGIS